MNVVLSYGLGVDSTAMFLRWLNEPDSRDFDLDDLLVVTAMTGNEWPDTVELVERHILPRFREAGVTFAQVARAGASQKDGIVYDRYLRGEVYSYVVAGGTPFEESCGGFIGLEYAKEEADRAAEGAAALLHDERVARAAWAARDVITVSAG